MAELEFLKIFEDRAYSVRLDGETVGQAKYQLNGKWFLMIVSLPVETIERITAKMSELESLTVGKEEQNG